MSIYDQHDATFRNIVYDAVDVEKFTAAFKRGGVSWDNALRDAGF